MRFRRFVLVVCGCSLLAGCKSYGPKYDARQAPSYEVRQSIITTRYPGPAALDESLFASINSTNEIRPEWLQPPLDFFTLGPGDLIEIEILGEGGSTSTALVGPDGKIYYSLLPGLFVWGLTLSQARELLVEELGKFLRVKPVIAVTLRSVSSKRVWILGSVQSPGVYSLAAPMTILEALSLAGGTTAAPGTKSGIPDLQNSFLLRKGKPLKVDFHRLLTLGDLNQNLYLQPDDFLYLRSATVRNVYVLGAVAAPNIIPYSEDLSLLSAISSAGGTVEYARISQVAIVRGSIAYPKIAFVDYRGITRGELPDVKLEQGDIVYVPFVFYRKLAVFAEQLLNQFVVTVAANEGLNAVTPGARVGGTVPVTGP